MNTAILYYQEPSSEPIYLKGKWQNCTFDTLPKDCFFISNHDNAKVYYFQSEDNYIDKLQAQEIHILEKPIFFQNKSEYLTSLHAFQADFDKNDIKKAIYSRIKKVPQKFSFDDALALFNRLCNAYRNSAFVYLLSDPSFGTWIGATPEILLKGTGEQLETMALAGTKREAEMVWTQKEYEEQKMVTDTMLASIQSYAINNLSVSDTHTVKKGAVFHLCNNIHFDLAPNLRRSLIQDLHPTPAVVGLPRIQASKLIQNYEKHDRGFYTGLIGRLSANEVSVFVNLRCLQVAKNHLALYLGGGITSDSVPELEWQETEDKSQTLLQFIQF